MSIHQSGAGAAIRSFRRDPEIAEGRKLSKQTVRRILGFARPYRRWIAIFLTLIAIEAAIGAATPLVYREIIDRGIARDRIGLVLWLSGLVGLLAIAAAAVGLVQRWFSARIGEWLIYDLRSQVFDHVHRMPVAFFSRTQTGALIQRLNGDVLGAQQAFTSTLSNVVSNLLTVVLVLAAMFVMSWKITLLALALVPIFLLPARFVGRKLRDLTARSYRLNADMAQTMTERFNVSGAILAKVFEQPGHASAQFRGRASDVRDVGVGIAMYGAFLRIALGLVAALAVGLVYAVGGVFAIQGTLGIGTIVALTSYLNRLYGPLTALSNVQVDVMTTLVSFDRVLEVLDLPPMVRDRPSARPLPADAPADIEFDHVSFHYPAASEVSLASLESTARLSETPGGPVLTDLGFRVEPGRMVALVGPSGAGKSTVTSLVPRLYDVSDGAVRVGGHDVRELTQDSLRARIGLVTQDAHLYHDTIRSNLTMLVPADTPYTDEELERALRAAQIWDLVASLPEGLDTVVGDRGYRMSGGERQRLAIARVLLKAPSIVILDEATAHLDSESETKVQAALDSALAGRTSLVIAHRLATVQNADEILVLDEGELVEQGTHAELLDNRGLYARLYETQFAGSSQLREPSPSAPHG